MTNLEKVIMCGNTMRQFDGTNEPSGFEATLATVYYYAKFKQGNESDLAHMAMFAACESWRKARLTDLQSVVKLRYV